MLTPLIAPPTAPAQAMEGVVGVALGHRLEDGIPRDEPCVSVFVRDKLSRASLKERGRRPIPRSSPSFQKLPANPTAALKCGARLRS